MRPTRSRSPPTKTAGLTPISNELADDSTPEALDLIAAGLSNQITRAIDGAYLANTTAKGPNGLLSIAYTGVETGTSLANLDPFVAARFAAKTHGSDLTSWIVSPAQAEALSKLKVASGSNQSLIQFVEDGITVAGLPVLVSDQVDANTKFWGGIPLVACRPSHPQGHPRGAVPERPEGRSVGPRRLTSRHRVSEPGGRGPRVQDHVTGILG